MKLKIGKHEVGDGCKPFIIAEVGSNWKSFDDCKHSISMAKQCGADAVKFQAFDFKSLYGMPLIEVISTRSAEEFPTQFETRGPGALPINWLPKLKEKADACGIEFMCSAFSPELVEAVDPFVNVHKVASAELTHVRILEKLRTLGKPVILSTGASGIQDIQNALKALGSTPVILMYCVSAYPAQEVMLETIEKLKAQFNLLVGYSDHSSDVLHIPVESVRKYGACVLEKHFTAFDFDTPDRPHSLMVDQFKRMVLRIDGKLNPAIGASLEEQAMLKKHNRRLIATRDIAQNEMLNEGVNFGIYRSLREDTHALSPWCIDQVNGKSALKSIQAGEGIGPGDV
jgi:N,N'-diacetyllegionaminate synthase